MNCVGIDISKGKSMIAVMRPFGEVVVSPFEVLHTDSELSKLARLLKSLDGETRVVMELSLIHISSMPVHTPNSSPASVIMKIIPASRSKMIAEKEVRKIATH